MDIKEFYPSIKEHTLNDAFEFAKKTVEIGNEDLQIIMQARKSLLYNDGIPWIKKDGSYTFDVTMGSFDGAEACGLVVIYLLSKLSEDLQITNVELYRDDGLKL